MLGQNLGFGRVIRIGWAPPFWTICFRWLEWILCMNIYASIILMTFRIALQLPLPSRSKERIEDASPWLLCACMHEHTLILPLSFLREDPYQTRFTCKCSTIEYVSCSSVQWIWKQSWSNNHPGMSTKTLRACPKFESYARAACTCKIKDRVYKWTTGVFWVHTDALYVRASVPRQLFGHYVNR